MICGMIVVVEQLFDESPFVSKLLNLKRSFVSYLLLQFNHDVFLVRDNDATNGRPLLATAKNAWNE
jgi:hypothetical protein